MRRIVFLTLFFILSILFVRVSQRSLSQDTLKQRVVTKVRFLPKTEILKAITLEYKEAVSDLFWMQLTLIYGERDFAKKATQEDWDYLYKITALTTELNPYFFIPYYFAGVVLPWQGKKVEEAVGILQKGLTNLPENWMIPFLIGFNLFYFLDKKKEAAEYLIIASKLPESPKYLSKLASRLLYEAGDIQSSIMFLEEMYRNTEDENIRKELVNRIKALRDIAFLEEGVRIYKRITGRLPRKLEDLVKGGIITRIPEEPYGGYYYLDTQEGRVKSSSKLRKKK